MPVTHRAPVEQSAPTAPSTATGGRNRHPLTPVTRSTVSGRVRRRTIAIPRRATRAVMPVTPKPAGNRPVEGTPEWSVTKDAGAVDDTYNPSKPFADPTNLTPAEMDKFIASEPELS